MTVNRRLGKRPPLHDVRTLELADYLKAHTLPGKVPPAWDWSSRVQPTAWTVLGNDTTSDCVQAAIAHLAQLWTTADGNPFNPTTQQTLLVYSQMTGYDPALPFTDRGTFLLNAMNFWRSAGFLGHSIDAFASFPQHGPKKLMQSIYLFGGAIVGLALPLSAQTQVNAGLPWSLTQGPQANIGSWGGHCVPLLGYSPQGLTCVTWGHTQDMSWDWFNRYCDEAYTPLSRDWTGPDNLAPNTIRWKTLSANLQALRSSQSP